MGYHFTGFFAAGDGALLEATNARWPRCESHHITSPFYGVGLRCPDPNRERGSEEQYERLAEEAADVEEGLPEFSAGFPELRFVFVTVDCAGGTCEYAGFVARNGSVEAVLEPSWDRRSLAGLLKCLGVNSPSGFFQPFVRGYWFGR